MKNLLIVYATKSGSTAEVAEFVGQEIRQMGLRVVVKPIDTNQEIDQYDAFMVGGPMLMGWHPQAAEFIKKNEKDIGSKPLACFMTAMSLTQLSNQDSYSMPVWMDPLLVKPPLHAGKLNFKEKFTLVSNYIKPVLSAGSSLKPKTIALFGGNLDLTRLNLFERLFVQLIIGVKPGDKRNWDFIQTWAKDFGASLDN